MPEEDAPAQTRLERRAASAGRRSATPAAPPLPGGMVAAAAVLAALGGLVLWVHLLAGPVRLATGLLDSARHLEDAGDRLTAGANKAARFQSIAGSAGADRARGALSSPLVEVFAAVPKIGPAIGEAPHLVEAAEHSSVAARTSLRIATNALQGPQSVIARVDKDEGEPGDKNGGNRIRLDRIVAIGGKLDGLRAEVLATKSALEAIDLDNLPERAHGRITKAIRKADEAKASLDDAKAAFEILPAILGAEEKRNYLIGFQNSAEQRGTGGAILQFVLLTVDDGDFKLERGGSIYDVDKNREQLAIDLPPDAWYQRGIPDARRFGNANWSPDFPLSTQLLLDYAYASSDEFARVDGVLAVDPIVMEELMPAVGRLGKGRKAINRKDIVRYVLNEAYGRFPVPSRRRTRLQNLVNKFFEKVFDPQRPTELLEGLSDSLAGKHMQIWMKEPAENDFITRMNWDGAIEQKENSDYLYVVEQNVGGNKLDYFDVQENEVDITLDENDATTSTTMSFTNGVLLPQARWVMGDSGAKLPPIHRPMAVLYAHGDAELQNASVDGTRVDTPEPAIWPGGVPQAHTERGKTAWATTMEALPGETVSATLDYSVPGIVRTVDGRKVYRLTVQHQPKVRPDSLTIDLRLPEGIRDVRVEGWKRKGKSRLRWEGELKRDMMLEVSWRN